MYKIKKLKRTDIMFSQSESKHNSLLNSNNDEDDENQNNIDYLGGLSSNKTKFMSTKYTNNLNNL